MKKNFLLIMCAVALVFGLYSCNGKAEKEKDEKEALRYEESVTVQEEVAAEPVKETSSIELGDVKLPSQLKDKVEVIKTSKKVEKYGYPSVTITFKLLSTVNTKPLSSSGNQMWIIGIGQDEDGIDVNELLPSYKEWRTDDRDGSMFREFLESDPGETITLTFTGTKNDGVNVSNELEKVKKFKLKLTK